MMKISIVLPLYNSIQYLDNCLHSISLQTFRDFELIVIQDGITQTSKEEEKLVLSYSSKLKNPIIYKKKRKNEGIAKAWNDGFSLASGEYFTWIGHDDLYFSNALKNMNDFLDTNLNIGMVYPDLIVLESREKEPSNYQEFIVTFNSAAKSLKSKIGSSRVLIYGAGSVAEMLFDSLDLKKAEIVDLNAGIPDISFPAKLNVKGVNHPNILHDKKIEDEFDFILVTPLYRKREIQDYFRNTFPEWVSEKAIYMDDFILQYIPANFIDLISLEKVLLNIDSIEIRKDEKIIKAYNWEKPDFTIKSLFEGNFLSHVGMYRSYIRDKIGEYNDNYKIAMDYDYVLRMSEHFKIMRLPDTLAIINNNENTYTLSNYDIAKKEAAEIIKEVIKIKQEEKN